MTQMVAYVSQLAFYETILLSSASEASFDAQLQSLSLIEIQKDKKLLFVLMHLLISTMIKLLKELWPSQGMISTRPLRAQ